MLSMMYLSFGSLLKMAGSDAVARRKAKKLKRKENAAGRKVPVLTEEMKAAIKLREQEKVALHHARVSENAMIKSAKMTALKDDVLRRKFAKKTYRQAIKAQAKALEEQQALQEQALQLEQALEEGAVGVAFDAVVGGAVGDAFDAVVGGADEMAVEPKDD